MRELVVVLESEDSQGIPVGGKRSGSRRESGQYLIEIRQRTLDMQVAQLVQLVFRQGSEDKESRWGIVYFHLIPK